MKNFDLLVTRHDGLENFLVDEGVVDEEIERMEHVDADDVQGKDVVGNLPLHLAAEAGSYTEVSIEYPPEYRGEELDADEVAEYAEDISAYEVEKETLISF